METHTFTKHPEPAAGLFLLDLTCYNASGEAPNMDPLSDNKIWFLPNFSEKDSEKELLARMGVDKKFNSPTKFSDISDNQLQKYAGIFIPGGANKTHLRQLGAYNCIAHFAKRLMMSSASTGLCQCLCYFTATYLPVLSMHASSSSPCTQRIGHLTHATQLPQERCMQGMPQ